MVSTCVSACLDDVGQRAQDVSSSGREPVVNPQPLPAGLDQPGAPEVGEVPRDRRLRQLQRVVHLADADSPPTSSARMRSRVASARALNSASIVGQPGAHIFALTNIARLLYSSRRI
jgi:hypothetical protein